MMIRDEIRRLMAEGVQRAQDSHQLPAVPAPEIPIERPASCAHGDYASSLALKMARATRMRRMEIASTIARHLTLPESVTSVQVAPPGFMNFYLSSDWLARQVDALLAAGARYGAPGL